MNVQDESHNQYMHAWNYCGRFKNWQMALIFFGGMLILFAGLPLLCHVVGLL